MFDETMTKDEILNWVKTRLNFSCGDMHNNLIPFNVQQFNEFDLAYHSDYMDSAGLWGFKNANGEVEYVCQSFFLNLFALVKIILFALDLVGNIMLNCLKIKCGVKKCIGV